MISFWVTNHPKTKWLKTTTVFNWFVILLFRQRLEGTHCLCPTHCQLGLLDTGGWNNTKAHFLTTYVSGSWYCLLSGISLGAVTQTLSYGLCRWPFWLLHSVVAGFQERISPKDHIEGSHVAFYDLVIEVTEHHFRQRSRLTQIQRTWILPHCQR